MNIPFSFGLPQIILLIIALAGFALFVYAAHSLLRGEKYYDVRGLTREEKDAYYNRGRLPRRRHVRWQHGLGGVLLLAFAVSLLWMTFLIQSYLGLTGDIKVAEVKATTVANSPTGLPLMSVDLTLYSQDGHVASDSTYLVNGNEWMLQGDIIKFTQWLNVAGLHSGYKLTRLEGRFDDPNQEENAKHTVVTLNGGDDGFFKNVHAAGWLSSFVDAQYGNAVFQANGTFNIYVSQTGLYAQQVSS